ncbi:MAG TPA: hypothetical protein VE843_12365, partial [Ktedonobacteraceae bacterium]|nr:hypothetical protein [Ktedonobacteraceae bacterium]
KRLIDEGHSIRTIKKALLKGKFDAQKYFSHQRTFAAHYMVHTGTLPAPEGMDSPLRTRPLEHTLPETGPLVASGRPIPPNRDKNEITTHSTYISRIHEDLIKQKTLLFFEQNDSLFFAEGLTPDPAKKQLDRSHVIESTLVALPTNSPRSNSGSLWSYSDKLPAAKSRAGNGQFIKYSRPKSEGFERSREKKYPSSSLWSYTDKQVAIEKGH